MIEWIKRLFGRNASATPLSLPAAIPEPAPPTLTDLLATMQTCAHEPAGDFYYRTEAANGWGDFFTTEFRVTCRNPKGLPSQDLVRNLPLQQAAAGGALVYAFYYYDSFNDGRAKINSFHRQVVRTDNGMPVACADKMLLCLLTRYRKTTAALVGRQNHLDQTQANQGSRYIICNDDNLHIPQQDIQLYLEGQWYPLPAIDDLTLSTIMTTWKNEAHLRKTAFATLLKALKV
ncbi:hypothetical protein LGQ10_01850 [Pseudomonas sp. L5B5]|uniref:hypothetical protein n=1 Tax=Pseudomonas sp. L5B5 TaxID=2883205 RepID=UPI001CF9CBC7|nr:hypothetical protein [Pseudomonas sp. L5B5]UCZ85087.1 hypothetical protein LGQ10_01850 [Pseudomonas sp. L5B5]